MKREIYAVLLAGFIAAMPGSALAQGEVKWFTDEELKTITGMSTAELLQGVVLEDVVNLGEYRGLNLKKEVREVTEDAVEAEVQFALSMYPVALSEGSILEKDTVHINYYISFEGEALYNGSGEGKTLVIGRDEMGFEGFDEKLIGLSIGEKAEFSLVMPEGYSDLGGKTVDCEVLINGIQRSPSEATDSWVQQVSDFNTVEEYRESIAESLESSYEFAAEQSLRAEAWEMAAAGAEILEYPENLLQYGRAAYQQYLKSYAGNTDGDLDAYLEQKGISLEEYQKTESEYAERIIRQMLVANAIGQAEQMSEGDSRYQELLEAYAESYGLEKADFLEQAGEDNVNQMILLERCVDLIVEEAVIEEASAAE